VNGLLPVPSLQAAMLKFTQAMAWKCWVNRALILTPMATLTSRYAPGKIHGQFFL
jgi:hypothetical protein